MAKKKDENKFKEMYYELKDKIADMEGNFEEKVAEHPVQSVSVAFGVGVMTGAILTALMRRR
jgi:ElaB/YqjD/DUF883 family membrane-anchored ribosome-binding protein